MAPKVSLRSLIWSATSSQNYTLFSPNAVKCVAVGEKRKAELIESYGLLGRFNEKSRI